MNGLEIRVHGANDVVLMKNKIMIIISINGVSIIQLYTSCFSLFQCKNYWLIFCCLFLLFRDICYVSQYWHKENEHLFIWEIIVNWSSTFIYSMQSLSSSSSLLLSLPSTESQCNQCAHGHSVTHSSSVCRNFALNRSANCDSNF